LAKTVSIKLASLLLLGRMLFMLLRNARYQAPCSRVPSLALRRRQYASAVERLPRVAQPSFWTSLIPRFMRLSRDSSTKKAVQDELPRWNPATFYIWIFLLIGSNSINMITLRNEYTTFDRKTDSKIAQLREVFEKVQRGEEVDVKRALGTGDAQQEQEWKDGTLHSLSVGKTLAKVMQI